MTRIQVALVIVGTAFAMSPAPVTAQEKKLERKDLPAAVEKTVSANAAGATIRGFSTEVEGGQRIYEAQMTVDGHSRDISIDARGRLLEVEDEVAFDRLPADVQAGLTKAAAGAKVGKVEALSKGGKLVAYESVVTVGGRHHEIQVGPDGKKLAHPE